MPGLHLDYETRSELDLGKVGAYKYANHPSTQITHAAWQIGDDPMQWWTMGEPVEKLFPLFRELAAWEDKPERYFVAHNAAFERYITNFALPRQFPQFRLKAHMPPESWNCTMARSLAFGLPGGLDKAAAALQLGISKLKEGRALLSKYYSPWEVPPKLVDLWTIEKEFGIAFSVGQVVKRPDGANRRVTEAEFRGLASLNNALEIFKRETPEGVKTFAWRNNPDELERISEYNRFDVTIEMQIDKRLPNLIDKEFRVWCLDQEINERGVPIDVERVKILADVVAIATDRANERITAITDGEVNAITKVSKIADFLRSRGYDVTSFTKDLLSGYLEEAEARGDDVVREVISLRDDTAKASVKKLYSMLEQVNPDGFIRDNLQYYGAGTGRWAGRGVQMQNIARLKHKSWDNVEEVLRYGGNDPENVLAQADLLEIPLIADIGAAMRSMLLAPEGLYFVGGDFSNIEGRVNCWLAGELWKIKAFLDYDTFLKDENGEVKRDEKGEPLRKGVDLYKLAFAKGDPVAALLVSKDDRQKGKAQELALGYQGGPAAFLTFAKNLGFYVPAKEAEALVLDWRSAHPKIVQNWWDLQDAGINAVLNPGTVYPASDGKIKFKCQGNVLYCNLPSGRNLVYPYAEVEYIARAGNRVARPSLTYKGVDSKTRQWGTQSLYGGKICENIVQALARDLMVDAMFRAKDAGFNLVLTVHDELLTLDSDPEREHELQKIMSVVPDWAYGLPLAAECWADKRYVK